MTERRNKRPIVLGILFSLLLAFAAPSTALGKKNEYDAVCDHIEDRYQAKKVKIPFMWLARMAVGIVRPAGVKSFKVTVYRKLQYSRETLDGEMRKLMRDSFSEDWVPILRVISKDGEQVYMNMKEHKKSVKILLVTMTRDEAVVVRAKFNPEKLAEFIEDPKIFGISLNGKEVEKELESGGPPADVEVVDQT